MTQKTAPIILSDYSAEAAVTVLSDLDRWDRLEGDVMRGGTASPMVPFADWHMMQAHFLISWVFSARRGSDHLPFAVCGAAPTGFAGVGQVAFLARDHREWRIPIARALLLLRTIVPVAAQQVGLRRLEAKCMLGHPTAPRFLQALGFSREALMPGFGPGGDHCFCLYSRKMEGR